MAEVVKFYYPKLVELHNYSAAHSMHQKMYNWETLNRTTHSHLDDVCSLARSKSFQED